MIEPLVQESSHSEWIWNINDILLQQIRQGISFIFYATDLFVDTWSFKFFQRTYPSRQRVITVSIRRANFFQLISPSKLVLHILLTTTNFPSISNF